MANAYEVSSGQGQTAPAEADLRAIGRSLWSKKALILGPTLLAAAAALFITGSITPLYRSEARVLVVSNDTVYTRPEGVQTGEDRGADELAIESQVQLLLSRDLARQVTSDLKLADSREFDPADGAMSIVKRMMILVGLSRDPMRLNSEERVLDAYYERLSVYAVPRSRVIVVEFSSSNPETAANVANAVTERYLEFQQTVKQSTTRKASSWLATQIDELSGRVADAEAKVEDFRSKSNLFLGPNSSITTQQLGELNTELARARAQQADAKAKADLIRETLKSGRQLESLDLSNSELIRRLSEQRVALASTIASEGRTYLPGHPRMKELKAQIDSFDSQIKAEASKLARAYENEADLSAGRVASVQSTIEAQKKVAGNAGGQEVQLRALERDAKAQRDLLEQFLARYRDAEARERVEASPPDARIISRASPTNTPYFPKPLAITVLTALAVFVLLIIGITASEFMLVPTAVAVPAGGAPLPREAFVSEPVPVPTRKALVVEPDILPEPSLSPSPSRWGMALPIARKAAGGFKDRLATLRAPRNTVKPVDAAAPNPAQPGKPNLAERIAAAVKTPAAEVSVEDTVAVAPQESIPDPVIRSAEETVTELAAADSGDAAELVETLGEIAASDTPVTLETTPAPTSPATPAEDVEIEAGDMRMLDELAAHLSSMPKGDQGALNILTVSGSSDVDAGSVALALARSVAGAGRKVIVADAGSGSRDFAAALPNPAEGGLGELIVGKTSFGQAIQRDRASASHLIAAGGQGLLTRESYARVDVVFDALGLTYDFVVVLSPSADRPDDMAALAKRTDAAILVSHVQNAATSVAHKALVDAGIADVIVLLTDANGQATGRVS